MIGGILKCSFGTSRDRTAWPRIVPTWVRIISADDAPGIQLDASVTAKRLPDGFSRGLLVATRRLADGDTCLKRDGRVDDPDQ